MYGNSLNRGLTGLFRRLGEGVGAEDGGGGGGKGETLTASNISTRGCKLVELLTNHAGGGGCIPNALLKATTFDWCTRLRTFLEPFLNRCDVEMVFLGTSLLGLMGF